jgi:hypothetical protein
MFNLLSFYKKIGVDSLSDFIDPIITHSDDFELPKLAIVHWAVILDIPTTVVTDNIITKNSRRGYIMTLHKYADTKGDFDDKSGVNVGRILKEFKRDNRNLKLLPTKTTSLRLRDTDVLVYNYSILNSLYKYKLNKLNPYYKWYNTFNKIVSVINNDSNSREHFIHVSVPLSLPSRVLLDKHVKNLTLRTVEDFPSPNYLTILDIWMFLTPEYTKNSVLYGLDDEKLKNTTLILTTGEKITMVGLYTLHSLVDEYPGTGLIKSKQTPENVRKLFYILMFKLNTHVKALNTAMAQSEMVKDVTTTSSNATPESDDKVIRDLDDILDKDVIDDEDFDVDADDNFEETLNEAIGSSGSAGNTIKVGDGLSIKDLKELKPQEDKALHDVADDFLDNGVITKREHEKINNMLLAQDVMKSTYDNKTTLKEMREIKSEDLEIKEDEIMLPSNPVITSDEMRKNTLKVYDKKYINNVMKKDITNVIYSLQNNNIIVEDHQVEINETLTATEEIHTIMVKPINGKPSKIVIKLPKVDENGVFRNGGNSYRLRKQRNEIPIRKINNTRVGLTTYFGKVFVDKAAFKKDDLGFWLRKKIQEIGLSNPHLKGITLLEIKNPDATKPYEYGIISRYIKGFTYKGVRYHYDYQSRNTLNKDLVLNDIETKGRILVGAKGNVYYLIDKDSKYYKVENKKEEEVESPLTSMGIDLKSGPVEFSAIKVYKQYVPVGLAIAYFIGFEKFLKTTGLKYEVTPANIRQKYDPTEYITILFNDYRYGIKRDHGEMDLLLAGFNSVAKELKQLEVGIMNNPNTTNTIFTLMKMSPLYINEIDLLNSMFIDPISKTILETLKEPTTFIGLILKANELLTNDNYKHPNNIEEGLIKGYERLPGMMYNELVNSVRSYNNMNLFARGSSGIVVNPYNLMNRIGSDSTSIPLKELNPITETQSVEDLTAMGFGGRSKETMSIETRAMHASEVGIVSESTKDSGDVGINVALSAVPKIGNVRGLYSKKPGDKLDMSNVLSVSATLAPFASNEDAKRTNFINIQNNHGIAMNNMMVPAVRTGYETILPYRTSAKFAVMAEEDLIVKSVSKSKITVESVKTKKTTSYSMNSWSTKSEAGTSYSYDIITVRKKGDKIPKGGHITFCPSYFEVDIFDKNVLAYKAGTILRLCLTEELRTYEDASVLSKKLSSKLGARVVKNKSYVIDCNYMISGMLNEGDKVEPATHLFSMSDGIMGGMGGLSKEVQETLERLKHNSPKAKVRGEIKRIRVMYNCELTDMSPSLRKLAKWSDEQIKEDNNNDKYNGQVNSGYSIDGKPLLPGEVQIIISISYLENMSIGDKGIIGSQLKTIVSESFDYDMKTEDGEDIDYLYSYRGIYARIVNSTTKIGTTTTVLKKIGQKAVDMYFK